MFRKYSFLALSFIILIGGVLAQAEAKTSEWVPSEYVKFRIVDDGKAFGVEVKMQPGWHIYYRDPGEAGWATEFDYTGSKNITVKEVTFPKYIVFDEYGILTNGYKGQVLFPIEAVVHDDAILKMNIKGAVCMEICIPFEVNLSSPVDGLKEVQTIGMDGREITLAVIFTAFLAGLILNIMPCVLPVLSLKVLSVVKQHGKEFKAARSNFIATAAGIISSFIALAVLTAVFKSLGHSLGWGLHFQSPIFVGILTVVTLLFGLSLLGLFHMRVPSWISDQGPSGDSLFGNFMAGVLATLLGTACTAPVLVTAVSFALAGGYDAIFTIFIVMGIGMALPYILFALRPQLVNFLPKPGKWMDTVKKTMALLLIGTSIWLASILYAQVQNQMTAEEETNVVWQEFDESAIPALVAEGKTVFVDVTAKWCVNCQVNKFRVMTADEMEVIFAQENIVTMRGDMTKPREDLLAYIKKYERYGIPFNIVYGPNAKEGILLPTLLSIDGTRDTIEKASSQ